MPGQVAQALPLCFSRLPWRSFVMHALGAICMHLVSNEDPVASFLAQLALVAATIFGTHAWVAHRDGQPVLATLSQVRAAACCCS